ncbi:hypothetical protein ACP70R_040457 [Stipagrostis hirtigluma subsp. patula]
MALPPDTPPPPEVPENSSFTATDHGKLLTLFLRRKIAGEPLPRAIDALFHDTHIYAAEPAMLTAGLRPAPARKARSVLGCSSPASAPRAAKIATSPARSAAVWAPGTRSTPPATSSTARATASGIPSSSRTSARSARRARGPGGTCWSSAVPIKKPIARAEAAAATPSWFFGKITATLESTTCSVIPETQKASDWSFSVAGDAPSAAEYCYGGYGSGIPLCASAAGTSGSWTRDGTAASFSGEMGGFFGGVPKYDECDIGGFAGGFAGATLEAKQPGEKQHGGATELDWSFLQL